MITFLTRTEAEAIQERLEEEIADLKEILESEPDHKITRNMLSRREQKLEALPKHPTGFMHFGKMVDGNPTATLNLDDCTFNRKGSSTVIFLTGRFQDGYMLGFWSQNPWGTTRNKDRGWAVINTEEMEIVEECEILSSGNPMGNDFTAWRKRMKDEHGKLTIFIDSSGDRVWKMTEE